MELAARVSLGNSWLEVFLLAVLQQTKHKLLFFKVLTFHFIAETIGKRKAVSRQAVCGVRTSCLLLTFCAAGRSHCPHCMYEQTERQKDTHRETPMASLQIWPL